MVWFTADTHFGHTNIIKHCNRPFQSIKEMDNFIIRNFNRLIQPNDEVWHLGDFCFKAAEHDCNHYLSKLNGKWNLILGNHDVEKDCRKSNFKTVATYKDIKYYGQHIVLFHYPMLSWNRKFHGSYHLYGHVHGTSIPLLGSMDVGVDALNFAPISLDDVLNSLKPNEDQ